MCGTDGGGLYSPLLQAGTAREILVNALQLERLAGGRLPDHSGDDLRVAVAIQHLHARGCLIPVRAAGERGSVQSGGVRISVESAPIKCHIRSGVPSPRRTRETDSLASDGGAHGPRPTGCGGHTGRTESSAPTKQNKNRANTAKHPCSFAAGVLQPILSRACS